jgi:Flp pilus assembly protein TadG
MNVRKHLISLHRDERGMSFVFLGMGFMAFLTATTLAIDVGMFMVARSQAQNAADAGALAGATALVHDSFTDRTASGPAVQSAISAALANKVVRESVSVGPGDVTFPNDPSGQPTRVRVNVFRNAAHTNGIPTLMGQLFGVSTVDIQATATAEASPANAMTCVKPFMIPDKWTEKVDSKCSADGAWTNVSTFDEFDKKGDPCATPDVYVPAGTAGYTGYTVLNDVGTTLTLRAGNQNQPNPSFYYSWKMPGDVGGDFYRQNIETCNQSVLVYDPNNPLYMIQEPGDKQGPTVQGIADLIAMDPGTYWSQDCKCVKGSNYATSPRVFPIPLFNPQYYAEGVATGRGASFELANFLGFYADYVDNSGGIHGIITNITGVVDPNAGPAPADLFPKVIRLVQ